LWELLKDVGARRVGLGVGDQDIGHDSPAKYRRQPELRGDAWYPDNWDVRVGVSE
jgi:hypothetical protein